MTENSDNPVILVVDDDHDIVDLVSMGLEFEDFTPVKAFNGYEALEAVRKHSPDLILLDIMMPDISGYEVCKELKMHRDTNLIPVIMLTAKLKESDRYEGFVTGADEYITKPFEIDNLINSVRRVLNENKDLKEKKGLKERINFMITSKFEYLKQVNELINKLFINTGLDESEIFSLKLALHELGVNAIEHGNRDDETKTVVINYTLFNDNLLIEIIDEGEGFDLDDLRNPTEDLDNPRGRGIFLVEKLMDKVEFKGPGNHVIMKKSLIPA